ncbi:MAG: hypothetical protein ACE5GA_09820, partial [Candidatus Zixiibacteriota bacterium]
MRGFMAAEGAAHALTCDNRERTIIIGNPSTLIYCQGGLCGIALSLALMAAATGQDFGKDLKQSLEVVAPADYPEANSVLRRIS